MNYDEALTKRNKLIFPGIKTYYKDPLFIIKGKGKILIDYNGNEYLDLYSGVATVNVGYTNDLINDKTIKQLNTIQHVPSLYLSSPMISLAEKLLGFLDDYDYKVMFLNSGSEAIEHITLLNRLYKNEGYILYMSESYHGMTLNANYLTGINRWKHHGDISLNGYSVDTPYCYRCKYGLKYKSCGFECALSVEKTIQEKGKDKFSSFIFESVLGVGGIIIPPSEYLDIVAGIVKKYDGLLVVDEVQTGIGRTGEWFGFQNFDFSPDAFALGKGLGNGMPIGAVIAKNKLADLTSEICMYSTFGGNPISCTYSLATIELMETREMVKSVKDTGMLLLKKLEEIYDYNCIGDIRGIGLMVGIEVVENKKTKQADVKMAKVIMEKLKERYILVGIGGVLGNVIRIAPTFLINAEDIDYFVLTIKTILNDYYPAD